MHDISTERDHRLDLVGVMPQWRPTHRHRKGGQYRVICVGIWEPTRDPVVIYDDADGTVWVRPKQEFEDGRFVALDDCQRED